MATASASTSGGDEDDMRIPVSGQNPIASQRRASSQTSDKEAKPVRLPSRMFPLPYKEAFSQWWTSGTSESAEAAVLSFVPFYSKSIKAATSAEASHIDHPTNPPLETTDERVCHSNEVALGKKGHYLNEFSITRPSATKEHPAPNNLVILHGYGAGLAFFYKNFDSLSRRPGWSMFALDMLGMGRSARPAFKIKATERLEKVREAEAFFVDGLEEWRVKRGLEKFTLMGHSLGGYLAVCYALKYPGRLDKLILASPVGIPIDPYAINEEIPEPPTSTMTAEVLQDQSASTAGHASKHAPPAEKRRPYPGWLTYLWDANISPFSLVRWSGPLGPRFVSGWTSRRFSQLPAPESSALHTYAYSLFRQRGSGEYALAYLLAPGAFARDPLMNRIDKVDKSVEMVFLYGENDWMDGRAGKECVDNIKANGGKASFGIISKAGHHLYLDNYKEFNKVLDGVLERVEREKKGKVPAATLA